MSNETLFSSVTPPALHTGTGCFSPLLRSPEVKPGPHAHRAALKQSADLSTGMGKVSLPSSRGRSVPSGQWCCLQFTPPPWLEGPWGLPLHPHCVLTPKTTLPWESTQRLSALHTRMQPQTITKLAWRWI